LVSDKIAFRLRRGKVSPRRHVLEDDARFLMSEPATQKQAPALPASSAFSFVLTLGIVNLFADMTYEGASGINGPFLGALGATAAAIGVISGVGEFLGYSLRIVAGYVSDKSGKYWLITFLGYAINLFAVPALALAGNWQLAAVLVIAERVGRAIRKPSVEAMLSYTTGTLGKGWVYAVNNALDQLGATLGPLLMAGVLLLKGSYQTGYAVLLIPTLLALATLAVAQRFFPHPSRLEAGPSTKPKGFTPTYWLSMVAGACIAAGLVSFELIAFHFARTSAMSQEWIPVFFSVAMATNAVASLLFGKLYDRWGLPVVLLAVVLAAPYAALVFLGSFYLALVGMVLWGIGFATQDTLLKAIVAGMLPEGKRNLAFGLFYTGYGCGWLVGSITTGLLYDRSLPMLIGFSIVVQLASLPMFLIARRRTSQGG
jgi:MFS family permease